ncbi:MAG: CaiB/BaiF CoA transferase family protein [Dehalococcoidia bacterium]
MEAGPLAGLRVLELGSMVAAPYCGKLLADLGADVIKAEPSAEGDPARAAGPFPAEGPHPERSALFLYLNTSKRSVTLDIRTERGRQLFRRLAASADLLIEDTTPGTLPALGLAYDDLSKDHVELIHVSITPFGQDGPYSRYRTYHLNQYHCGGFTSGFYEGKDSRAPACGGGYIAEYDAGLTASVACMAAVLARKLSGHGQYVDVSKQEAAMCLERVDIGRSANDPGPRSNWGSIGGLLRAKDGHLVITAGSDHQWRGLVDAMGNPEWSSEEWCQSERGRSDNADKIQPHIKEWTAGHTRDDLYHSLQSRNAPAGPVLNTAEARNWVQLNERGFFRPLEHPEAGTQAYPTTPYRFSSMKWDIRRAPLLGEHNEEVYCGELGVDRGELDRLAQEGVV